MINKIDTGIWIDNTGKFGSDDSNRFVDIFFKILAGKGSKKEISFAKRYAAKFSIEQLTGKK